MLREPRGLHKSLCLEQIWMARAGHSCYNICTLKNIRFRYLPVLLGLLLPVTMQAADEFNSLLRELDNLQAELEADTADQDRLGTDVDYESQPELFPESDEDGGLRREDTISESNVYIRINGVPYILQDVPLEAWFAPYVREIAAKGVITGYTDEAGRLRGLFGPADPVTLGQLAKIAVTAAGVDPTKCPTQVKNKSASGTWAAIHVACAEYLQWSAFVDEASDINRGATRTEVVVTILEAFGREFEVGTGQRFRDVSATFPLSGAIEAAALDGLVSGYVSTEGESTGFFGPFDNVNRAEASKIVALAIQQYGDQ